MTLPRIIPSLAIVIVTSACGVKSVGDLDDGGGTEDGESSSDGSVSSTSATSNSTTVGTANDTGTVTTSPTDPSDSISSEGSESVGTAESGTDTDIGCPPGMSACDPQEEFGQEAAEWVVDSAALVPSDVVDVSCVVAEFIDDGVTLFMILECDEEELTQRTVSVPHNPITPFNIGQGSSVRFDYRADPIFWINQWFSIRATDGRFIIGGVLGSAMVHPTFTEQFAPLEVTLAEDACEVDCAGIPCTHNRREAIDVAQGGDPVRIHDGNSGTIGETTQYTFVVGEAASGDDAQCDDFPPAWYAIIAYDSSEG